MADNKLDFKAGDKVISKDNGAKGSISRVCGDATAVFVKWDDNPTQQRMVEVKDIEILREQNK